MTPTVVAANVAAAVAAFFAVVSLTPSLLQRSDAFHNHPPLLVAGPPHHSCTQHFSSERVLLAAPCRTADGRRRRRSWSWGSWGWNTFEHIHSNSNWDSGSKKTSTERLKHILLATSRPTDNEEEVSVTLTDDGTTTTTATTNNEEEDDDKNNNLTYEERQRILRTKRWYIEGDNLCFYQRKGVWKRRKEIGELQVGQMLWGYKLKQDLIRGKTGPKIFFECGVGRIDSNNEWHIVNGMMRLGNKPNQKKSYVQKRLNRLGGKKWVPVYVSRIYEEGMFEVTETREGALATMERMMKTPKVPASTLQVGQEVEGKVVRVEPYGIIIDVNANRNGLLHICRVRNIINRRIDGAKDLQSVLGLERGSRVRVVVCKNRRKRMEFDFPNDIKDEAREEIEKEKAEKEKEEAEKKRLWEETKRARDEFMDEAQQRRRSASVPDVGGDATEKSSGVSVEDEEAAAWAAFAAAPEYAQYEEETAATTDMEEEDDSDYYDEDDEIEDKLGIGTY